MKKLIEIKDVSVRLGDTIVLKNINWEISKGESWIVCGPNGSGKSTLMKVLLAKLPNCKGRVYSNLNLYKDVGYVGFEMHQNIIRQELIKAEAEYFAGKINYREQNITKLSTGESRKFLIDQAIAKEPILLILDEPFDGLDSESRVYLKNYLQELIAKGIGILLVTHRIDEFVEGIRNFLILKNGKIEAKYINTNSTQGISMGLGHHKTVDFSPNFEFLYESFEDSKYKFAIEMVKINVCYHRKLIFDNFNWKVKKSENWQITGPNGSGKSTLVKLITGDVPQVYANSVKVLGKQIGKDTNLWDLKSQIGIVSPEIQLNYLTHLKAFEVIASGIYDSYGLFRNVSEAHSNRIEKLAHALDISYLLDNHFSKLSNGQKRLVLIARALIKPPKILILDEPTAGLDQINRKKILSIIQTIANTSTSVILISHYNEELLSNFKHLSLAIR